MEDAFAAESLGNEAVFGVFDGHYGKRAAIYAAENLARVLQGTSFVECRNRWSLPLALNSR